jgi:hypothetical protein
MPGRKGSIRGGDKNKEKKGSSRDRVRRGEIKE